MRVSKIRCDECKTEVEVTAAGAWYLITRFGDRNLLLVEENEDSFDICSLPCLVTWASHRELVRVAS